MKSGASRMRSSGVVVITLLGLSMLWTIGMPSVARGGAPGSVCVVKITADGEILGILVNKPLNFDIGVLVPKDEAASVPVACAGLNQLSLAIANQGLDIVTLSIQVFTNQGEEICAKGPFTVQASGGRGVTFASCLAD